MKFFIDTANIDEIREAASLGLLDGVTTNPTLLSREAGKGTYTEILKEICSIVPGPVSAEVVALDAAGMVEQGKKLHEAGIETNATLCFSANQALLVAKAGATYVSPFVGRLDDVGHRGMDLVADIVEIYNNYSFATQVIVASIRSVQHVYEAALMGADVSTIPFKVIAQLIKHPLTDVGIDSFLKDWAKVQK